MISNGGYLITYVWISLFFGDGLQWQHYWLMAVFIYGIYMTFHSTQLRQVGAFRAKSRGIMDESWRIKRQKKKPLRMSVRCQWLSHDPGITEGPMSFRIGREESPIVRDRLESPKLVHLFGFIFNNTFTFTLTLLLLLTTGLRVFFLSTACPCLVLYALSYHHHHYHLY